MLDEKKAVWLANLIAEAVTRIDESPGLTIEVEGASQAWAQLLPEATNDGQLGGFALNFPYQAHDLSPSVTLVQLGVPVPPDTITLEWEPRRFASILVRPDVPLVGLAHLVGDVLEKVVGAPPDPELGIHLEFGF